MRLAHGGAVNAVNGNRFLLDHKGDTRTLERLVGTPMVCRGRNTGSHSEPYAAGRLSAGTGAGRLGTIAIPGFSAFFQCREGLQGTIVFESGGHAIPWILLPKRSRLGDDARAFGRKSSFLDGVVSCDDFRCCCC